MPASRSAFPGRAQPLYDGMRRNSPSPSPGPARPRRGSSRELAQLRKDKVKQKRSRSARSCSSRGSSVTHPVASSGEEAVHVPKLDAQQERSCVNSPFYPQVEPPPGMDFSSAGGPSPFAPAARATQEELQLRTMVVAIKDALATLSANMSNVLTKLNMTPVENDQVKVVASSGAVGGGAAGGKKRAVDQMDKNENEEMDSQEVDFSLGWA